MNKIVALILLSTILLQACAFQRADSPASQPVAQDETVPPLSTPEPVQPAEPTSTLMNILPAITATQTSVMLTASGGNLYIRRGPDIRFDQIGVLYKDTSVKVLAHDVLLKWAQVQVPNSDAAGWVSLQTQYSSVSGDLGSLPEITPTEYPAPATIQNCTLHKIVIQPGGYILNSAFFFPDNSLWLPPGQYAAYDVDFPGEPEVLSFSIREGQSIDLHVDGSGDRRKCP